MYMYLYNCNLCSYINVRRCSLKRNQKFNMSCKSLKSHNNDNNKKTIFNIIYCERAKNDLFGKAYCKKKMMLQHCMTKFILLQKESSDFISVVNLHITSSNLQCIPLSCSFRVFYEIWSKIRFIILELGIWQFQLILCIRQPEIS